MTTKTNEVIKLEQHPVIKHDLSKLGQMVEDRLAVLNLDNLVATDQTIQSMKKLRTELNKEFKEFEEQRKVVRELVTKPYDDMNKVYKTEIAEKYKAAVDTLKDKITEFEDTIKKERELELELRFDELCETVGIDFVKYEQANIKVNLSDSMTSLKKEVDAFIERLASDVELIDTQAHKAEIMVEYKKSLNVSEAIKMVVERKAAEEAERKRLEQEEKKRRHNILITELNMVHDGFTNSYKEISANLYEVPVDDVANATAEEFDAMAEQFKTIWNQHRAVQQAEEVARKGLEAPTVVQQAPEPEPEPQQQAPALLTAKFAVQGTREQLEGLRDYMIENNLKYKNI